MTAVAHGNMGATETFDASAGAYHYGTFDANCVFTFSGAGAAGTDTYLTLELTQGAGAPWTATWPASVEWPGDTAPTLSLAGTDLLSFVTRDGGTTWYGSYPLTKPFHAISLTDASVQAITTSASGGFQSVDLDTETEDTAGAHSGSSAQIVIPAALNGRRMIFGANVGIAANATGARQAKLMRNIAGTPETLDYDTELATSSISFRCSLRSRAITVATGDTIEVQVWQSSGGNLNTVNADGLPHLYGYTVD
jgi:hypothetical protein